MRIIISPAKQMKENTDTLAFAGIPIFIDWADFLRDWIKSLSFEQQKKLWACNEKIARTNSERFTSMDLRKNLTPALLSYDGIQYTYMGAAVFEDGQYNYVQEHLRILSGFYGVLKPMDGVVPYRLEMQAKIDLDGHRSLYDFWGDALYQEVLDESRTIINLASKEYSKCIEKFLKPEDHYVTFVFENNRRYCIGKEGGASTLFFEQMFATQVFLLDTLGSRMNTSKRTPQENNRGGRQWIINTGFMERASQRDGLPS